MDIGSNTAHLQIADLIPGQPPRRVCSMKWSTRQVLAGAILAHGTMTDLGLSRVDLCPWALREGALLCLADGRPLTDGEAELTGIAVPPPR